MRTILLLAAMVSCGGAIPPSPFTTAETEQALAPIRGIEARCYGASQSARDARQVQLAFRLEIEASGRVQAIPTLPEPRDPALLECVRHALNELRFPAKGHDRIELDLQLGPPPS